MTPTLLRRVRADELARAARPSVDPATDATVATIVADVRARGEKSLREYAERLDGLPVASQLTFDRSDMRRALDSIDSSTREVLERMATRIRAFATAQRAAISEISVPVPGGFAGHTLVPIKRAGCYAPAGRAPLPSSLLMAAVTARVAGVAEVIVATPNPSPLMLAAAALADADIVLGVGGAQAIAAMAYGIAVPACDIIVGPGNRWVTAAKRAVFGDVAIDMLAGPSELVVLADATANPAVVAADLIAQAEHDPDAFATLVTTDSSLPDRVDAELARQLVTLSTVTIAREALANGLAVVCRDMDEAIAACDTIAPEHLQLSVADADAIAPRIANAGAVFVGERSAEVFGDYGVGGNHILPTQRGARFSAGLSVFTFLRARTWLRLDDPSMVISDVAAVARLEGLEGHARAAERRG